MTEAVNHAQEYAQLKATARFPVHPTFIFSCHTSRTSPEALVVQFHISGDN